MKKIQIISMLSILSCLWMLYCISSCNEKDPLGNIEGTVVDVETSQVVSGVNVTIVANSNTTSVEQSTMTGADGKFSFKDIEADSYMLSFSKNGYEDNSKSINLNAGQTNLGDVILTPIKPVLSVSTVLLNFGVTDNVLPIEISNTGKGELNWSIVEDLPWLSVNTNTGTTTTKSVYVIVSIDRSLLTETSQIGSFTINSNGGSTTVNATVGKEVPVLQVSTTLLDFGVSTNSLQIEITNIGQGKLKWSIVEDLAWLSVRPISGATTSTAFVVTVTVDRSLLTETSQIGSFTINSNGGSTTVNVIAGKEVPVLQVSVTSLDFGVSTNFLQIEITNIGQGELKWSIVEDLAWLSVSPISGTTTSTASVATVTVFTETNRTGSFVIKSNGGNVTVDVVINKPSPVWEENFDGNTLDLSRWSKIPRGRWGSDWDKYMSDYDLCHQVSDGKLILRGLRNEYLPEDNVPYLTGGVWTADKVAFSRGRIEIRAKLGKATGAWPAFWMLPFDNSPWPHGGEIDIMERLNGDAFAYQTVHSPYTQLQGHPPKGATGKIDPDDYNVYAVELYADSLSFFINNIHTFTYPRIETDKEGQFPFDREYFLLLDMQLGGSWVGEVEPADLPVEMWIDWVRFYKNE